MFLFGVKWHMLESLAVGVLDNYFALVVIPGDMRSAEIDEAISAVSRGCSHQLSAYCRI